MKTTVRLARFFLSSVSFACVLLASSNLCAETKYLFTDLGTLGGNFSEAMDINDSGVIVGYSSLSDEVPFPYHAFRTTGPLSATSDLGTMGGNYCEARAINNAGVIVGVSEIANGDTHAFSTTGLLSAANDLGTLGGGSSEANDINDAGVIVGSSKNADGNTHAFSTTDPLSAANDLGTLGGSESRGQTINNAGVIAGVASLSGGGTNAFSTTGPLSAASDLGILSTETLGQSYDGITYSCHDINESGVIVGNILAPPGVHASSTAGLLSGATVFGFTAENNYSEATSINDAGVIVGTSHRVVAMTRYLLLENKRAIVIRNGVMNDLNLLVSLKTPLNGFILERANAINKKGDIVGVGRTGIGPTSSGASHAFLLTAVEETAWDAVGFTKRLYGAFDGSSWPTINHSSLGRAFVYEEPVNGGFWLALRKSKVKYAWMSPGYLPKVYAYTNGQGLPKAGWFRIKIQKGKRMIYSYKTKEWIKDN